ncbi:MAG: aminotransferase class I/II-fold pyridoxal phosphate-dependent enzyme [Erysipelotrichaceae bacterium]|nr:aminotransferase class I/II-fold pyridoxal phosphate-dependent enzyme [Erysipelotrichaceae bacterium]
MVFFRNDYGQGCIEPIMKLLIQSNDESHPGYGRDEYCKKAAEILQSKFPDTPCDIQFVVSGSMTNISVIRHLLRHYEAVISCDTAHIYVHESGAIEAAGHKIIPVPHANGKLTAAGVDKLMDEYDIMSQYLIRPRIVYISNTTEMGTVYTRTELEDLYQVCKKHDLFLFIDGARMGTALMSGVDYTLNDLAKWCDVFSIGGTKCGALFGEAICIANPELKNFFRFSMKQSGAVMAKGWLIGLQFIGLFENDDFYKCAAHANSMAREIQNEIIELGYPLYMKSTTNLTFVVLNEIQYQYLKDRVDFEIWSRWDNDYIIRLVSSWHTKPDEVEYLKVYLQEAMQKSLKAEEETEEEEIIVYDSPLPGK